MGVYINGMAMPTRCWDCLLNTYGYCMASGEHSDIIPSDAQIPEWCPLIPVPPHGRLIDADALMDKKTWVVDAWSPSMSYRTEAVNVGDIMDAPTIISAKEGE